MGAIGAMCVPVIGGAVGAALDYVIATHMTWQVGTAVSLYYQNGDKWLANQKQTMELSKKMCGPMSVGADELKEVGKELFRTRKIDEAFKIKHTPRVDLNDIRKVPSVSQNLLANARQIAIMLKSVTSNDKVRDVMKERGIPIDLIDIVLKGLG
jgi:hypothetical protein